MIALVLGVLSVLVTVPATAQDTSSDAVERFRRLVATAAEEYDDGRYERALRHLEEAREIHDHPGVHYNIARTLFRLERCEQARSTFERYSERDDIGAEDRAAAAEQLEELETCGKPGTLAVQCAHPGEVRLSDGTVISCAETTELEPGSYNAAFVYEGEEKQSKAVEISAGQTASIAFDFVPEDTTTPAGPTDASSNTWKWVLVGAGAAVAITGLAVGEWPGGAIRRNAAENAAAEGDFERVDQIDDFGRNTVNKIELATLAVGLAVAGTGVVLLVVDPGSDEQAASVSFRTRF